jgi:hypothetical protein
VIPARNLGAVAVKVHPVHGAFRVDREDMYPVSLGLPDETLAAVLSANACRVYPGLPDS